MVHCSSALKQQLTKHSTQTLLACYLSADRFCFIDSANVDAQMLHFCQMHSIYEYSHNIYKNVKSCGTSVYVKL